MPRRRRAILCSTMVCLMTPANAFTAPLHHSRTRIKFLCSGKADNLLPPPSSSRKFAASTNADTTTTGKDLQHRLDILRNNSKLSLAPMMEYTDVRGKRCLYDPFMLQSHNSAHAPIFSTKRHFRHLVRLVSDRTLLYTEMVAANAIAHEREHALSSLGDQSDSLVNTADFDPSYLLRFLGQGHNAEGPSVLQVGGSDPEQLFLAAETVYEFNQMQQ